MGVPLVGLLKLCSGTFTMWFKTKSLKFRILYTQVHENIKTNLISVTWSAFIFKAASRSLEQMIIEGFLGSNISSPLITSFKIVKIWNNTFKDAEIQNISLPQLKCINFSLLQSFPLWIFSVLTLVGTWKVYLAGSCLTLRSSWLQDSQ